MWEQLKKDARKLEGEIEVKLSQYSRMGSGMESVSGPADSLRSLQGASQVQSDITVLLSKLQEVHTSMEADVSGSDIRHHTVTRHREILQDFSQEFRRLSSQISQVCTLGGLSWSWQLLPNEQTSIQLKKSLHGGTRTAQPPAPPVLDPGLLPTSKSFPPSSKPILPGVLPVCVVVVARSDPPSVGRELPRQWPVLSFILRNDLCKLCSTRP